MAAQHYTGGCQCGAVRYEVTADIDKTISCNCSRCGKLGSILAFAPAEQFTLLQGEDQLTEYRFNRNVISHLFCKICGIESFARAEMPDGTKMAAINVRCLDGIEIETLSPMQYNGRAA
ncbi:GFA family protein [Flaviflagellibacter deserti]|uniref:GFA family protein n=1 Tax=Flaviflagellibacter deserti TaxID=2267266 RepID=A0ABV9Z413_9HYPH